MSSNAQVRVGQKAFENVGHFSKILSKSSSNLSLDVSYAEMSRCEMAERGNLETFIIQSLSRHPRRICLTSRPGC